MRHGWMDEKAAPYSPPTDQIGSYRALSPNSGRERRTRSSSFVGLDRVPLSLEGDLDADLQAAEGSRR